MSKFDNYFWVCFDTNPTTQVYSSASNGFVANNAAAYLNWLAVVGVGRGVTEGTQFTVRSAANNGSGAIRLVLDTTANISGNIMSGQYWRLVSGTGADGNYPVTVIDSTHVDLVGSSYSANLTGTLVGARFSTTTAGLMQFINQLAYQNWQTIAGLGQGANVISQPAGVPFQLTNTPAAVQLVSFAGASPSNAVKMPPNNTTISVPIDTPIYFENSGVNSFKLQDSGGNTFATVQRGVAINVFATANGQLGPFRWSALPNQSTSVQTIFGVDGVAPSAMSLSQVLDFIGGTAQGDVLYRDSAGWARLGAGTLGQMLMTGGPTANPFWANAGVQSGVGSRDISLATGTQAITTVGFRPTRGIFLAVLGGTGGFSIGLVDNLLNQNCVLGMDGTSPHTYTVGTSFAFWYFGPSAGTNQYKGTIQSWDANGFTIAWTKIGSPSGSLSYFWLLER
jgi:hypothetical protein